MELLLLYSGTVLSIVTFLFGVSSGLECISCEWTAGETTEAGCVSAPFRENTTQCEQTIGNANFICETKVKFRTESDNHYLSSVTRSCVLEHGNCDNLCDPMSGKDCFICCNNKKCNSIPLSSDILPDHLTYNITNTAADCVFRSGTYLFSITIFSTVNFLMF
ncbi:uncharacterized protein LOC134705148 [Mytilus trossulus]|uniref:uncharacterized protein LOC134705148 n=1 Tax=Mytilus trossulus TaxID=6551 RepID=UPI003004693C